MNSKNLIIPRIALFIISLLIIVSCHRLCLLVFLQFECYHYYYCRCCWNSLFILFEVKIFYCLWYFFWTYLSFYLCCYYFILHQSRQSILVQRYPATYFLLIGHFHPTFSTQSIYHQGNGSFLVVCACPNNCKSFKLLSMVMVLTS